jgi:glutamine amidotransferase
MLKKYIAIIDYNAGNIKSVSNAFTKLGGCVEVTNNPTIISNSSAIVLPGVGSFGDALKNLQYYKLVDILKKEIKRKPFLGICLGMQLLFENSSEQGLHEGLGIFKGKIIKIPSNGVKIPHMGWNQINIVKSDSKLFKSMENFINFYFVHSYYVMCKESKIVSSTTEHGINLTASIEKDNIFAVQFHPEKSSAAGMKVLQNFLEFVNI